MAGVHSSATVATDKRARVTRAQILAPEACPLSTAIETLVELQANLDYTIEAERRTIRDSIARHQENLRRRELLLELATELEARLIAQPRRARRKKVA